MPLIALDRWRRNKMSQNYKILSWDLFLRQVKFNKELPHVFLLGAGASRNSGVPTAEELIWRWKEEIYKSNNILFTDNKLSKKTIQRWIDEKGASPSNGAREEYSFFADKTFLNADQRRKYFNKLCIGISPSSGYQILRLLAEFGFAQIVFTTNFDGLFVKSLRTSTVNLVEVTIETAKLIHEHIPKNTILSIALHGDYKYTKLKNTAAELDALDEDFKSALHSHLYNKNLIVMGYSGRDHSLMNSIENAYQCKGSGELYWCNNGVEINDDVKSLLNNINGFGRNSFLVDSLRFDQSMLNIGEYCFSDDSTFQAQLYDVCNQHKTSTEIQTELSNVSSNLKSETSEKCYLSLVTLLNLVGSWNENNELDKNYVASLTGTEYTKLVQSTHELLLASNSHLVCNNGKWLVKNRHSFWLKSAPQVFNDSLECFQESVSVVLSEVDSQFKVVKVERYPAQIYGKELSYSPELRKGLTETLALLGCEGEVLKKCTKFKPRDTASAVIRKLLDGADWQLWASLGDLLPTLSEAAPNEFLHAVEDALRKTPSPFRQLYEQEGSGIGGRNHMTGLLWALECLAWSEEHLVRVSRILARLSTHDPGGSWANRPSNSLKTILMPWYPQTLASWDKQLVSVKTIRKQYPEVAWKLLIELLPRPGQISSQTYKPRWRNPVAEDWKPKVSKDEYRLQVGRYATVLVEMAEEDVDKLAILVRHLDVIPPPALKKVLEHLGSDEFRKLPEDKRIPVWNKLLELTKRHRRFHDENWALPAEVVSKIEKTADVISPESIAGVNQRLFIENDFELYEDSEDWKTEHEKVVEKQKQVVQEIYEKNGLHGIVSFISSVESPYRVGFSLGVFDIVDLDIELLPSYLDNEAPVCKQFIDGFAKSRYANKGSIWIEELNCTQWSTDQICQLLLYLPFDEEVWNLASTLLGDSEHDYWIQVREYLYQTNGDLLIAVDKLLEVDRPIAAIECLRSMQHKKLPFDRGRVVVALLSASTSTEPMTSMRSHSITELIKALQQDAEVDTQKLSEIEWSYLPLLEHRDGTEPKCLEARLATEPNFFCHVVQSIYRSFNEPKTEQETSQERRGKAQSAFGLLLGWKKPPGLADDGSFSSQDFTSWLDEVRKLSEESGHLDVALRSVGKVMVYCPPDADGLWLDKNIADVLDSDDAEEMRSGFCIEITNSRGAHWVDPSGKPERDLADYWRLKADQIENAGYSCFATSLRELADSYDRDADRIIAEYKAEADPPHSNDIEDNQEE